MRDRTAKTTSRPRSPRFRIGPGLAVAILVSAGVWFFTRPDLQAQHGRPVVDRSPLPASRPPRSPEVAELLKHADELQLTAPQRRAIGRLVKEWELESADRRREMQRAAAAFQEFMQGAEARGKGGLGEIQRNAADASALTSQWLARKAYFWSRGLAVLEPGQREKASRLLEQPLQTPERFRTEARS